MVFEVEPFRGYKGGALKTEINAVRKEASERSLTLSAI